MREIPLSQGLVALVDDEDYERLAMCGWCAVVMRNHGKEYQYAVRSLGGYTICMHRVIMDAPDGVGVKHINHNTLDNRRENLRLANGPRHRLEKFRGVYYQGEGRYYVWVRGKYLGAYHTPEAAAMAYNCKAIEVWGKSTYLNPVTQSDVDQAEQVYAERTKKDRELCTQLREFRRARGWTQQDLADVLGINPSYVCRLETGRLYPSDKLARAIQSLLCPS